MDKFINISQQLGNDILFTQGAGGNASIKIDDKLYIKASGYKLKNMRQKHGFACGLYKPLASFIKKKKTYSARDEDQFLQLINDSLVQSKTYGAPSMETGFHAVIPSTYVFHLHSVYANILSCMKYGSHVIKKVCKDIPHTIIEYKNPGYELAYVLAKKKSLPPLIFLKNHGIIIHGETLESCVTIAGKLHKIIEDYLKEQNVYTPFIISSHYKKPQHYSFPDSAVFSNITFHDFPENKQKDLLEIISAEWYISSMIKRLGKTPSYLSKKDIDKLLSMQQEKHRVKIFSE